MRVRLDGRQAPRHRERALYRLSLRKWSMDKLLDAVRALILVSDRARGVTVDEIALTLRAKQKLVHQCFHKLNLEGVMSQGRNYIPHDINRGPHNYYSGWLATIYFKREKS